MRQKVGSMDIQAWLRTQEYLPSFIRDFHDQKNLFKSIHHLYQDNEWAKDAPSWRDGHIYVIDWFLWFMAGRGYTLQKSRKKGIKFYDLPEYREILDKENDIPKESITKDSFIAEEFTKDEFDLFRQWFNAVQDLNEPYLEKADYELMEKVKSKLI